MTGLNFNRLNTVYRAGITSMLVFAFGGQAIEAQYFTVLTGDSNQVQLPDSILQREYLDLATFEHQILDWYLQQGYLLAQTFFSGDSSITVNEGCRFALHIKAGDNFQNLGFKEQPGFFTHKNLQDYISKRLNEYEKNGYRNASITIKDILIQENRCSVNVKLDEQPANPVFADGLIVRGNRLISEAYISKIAGFSNQAPTSQSRLDLLNSRLQNSDLFESVSGPEFILVDEKPYLLINLQERSLNTFDGVLGYAPDATGKGQIVGDVELALWGALSDGNSLDVNYQRLEPETSRLGVSISQHWLGNLPIGANLGFNFYQNDSTYQSRQIQLGSYYDLQNGLKISGSFNRLATTGTSRKVGAEPSGLSNRIAFGFSYSTLIGAEVPRSGLFVQASLGSGVKSIEGDSVKSSFQRQLSGEIKWFVPVSQRSVLAFRSFAELAEADYFNDSELFRIGGAKSLRGYNEEQFRASAYAWGDVEFRYLTDANSYLFVFSASGIYHRPRLLAESSAQFKQTSWVYSAGLGISYKIRVGRLKFTYALSPQESIGNGKVHVSIITRL